MGTPQSDIPLANETASIISASIHQWHNKCGIVRMTIVFGARVIATQIWVVGKVQLGG